MKNLFRYFTVFLITLSFDLFADEIRNGNISGLVVDNHTQQPLPGVSIMLVGTEIGTVTDLEGQFYLANLRPGSYHLRFQMMGYEPQTKLNIPVSPDRTQNLSIGLVQTVLDMEGVTVTADFFKKAKDAVISDRSIDFTEFINDPGSAMDIQRMMQALPSVVSGSDQYNEIVVRGGAPGENLFIIDHIEMPNPNHFGELGTGGGPVSMINPLFIDEVDFYAGSFPARYGDKASSVMDVKLREGNREKFESVIDMGMSGIGVQVEGPWANKKGSYMLSYHKSYLDLIVSNIGLTAVPRYHNAHGKIVYDLNNKHKLIWNGIYGKDRIDIVDEDGKASRGAENVNVRGWEYGTGLSLKSLWNSKTYSILTLSQVGNNWWYRGFHDDGTVYFRTDNTETETTLKGDLVYRFDEGNEITTGFSIKRLNINTLYWADSDTMFGRAYYIDGSPTPQIFRDWPIPGTINSSIIVDTVRIYDAINLDKNIYSSKYAAHFQWKYNPWSALTILAGLRWDYFAYNDYHSISPRLGISYALTPVTKINAGYGRHYQSPLNLNLISETTNKNLKSKYTDQVVVGFEHLLARDIRATVEFYSRCYHNVDVYKTSTTLDSLDSSYEIIDIGKGHAEGVEFFIQKKLFERFRWIGSYSYCVAKQSDPRYPEREYNTSYDYRHIFTVVFGYREKLMDKPWYQQFKKTNFYKYAGWLLPIGDEIELGVRWRYLGGKPYNRPQYDPYLQHWYTPSDQDYNASRFPAYHRLDIQYTQRYIFKKVNLVFYMEVQNVYNRDNIWDYTYNSDGTVSRVSQYSLFPVGGFILEF